MLIVGLGNPGKKYENTRHNIGYMVIDELKTLRQAQGKPVDFILAKTDTFMNESGKAIKKIIKNYKLKTGNLIVIHDDIDLPLGEFKIQRGRGAAGHKGVQSVINKLGTKDFWRIRVGICPLSGKPKDVEKFVLQKFTRKETKKIKEVIEEAAKKLGSSPQLLQ